MSSQSNVLVEAMLRLSPNERAVLIDTLIMSLDKPDAALGEQWLDEPERRLEAYRSGKLGTVDVEDVFKEMLCCMKWAFFLTTRTPPNEEAELNV